MRFSNILLIVLALFGSRAGIACQCRDASLEQQLADAQYAFIAIKSSSAMNEEGRVSAVMLVTESFKGGLPIGRQVTVDHLKRTSCEAFIPDDERLLILGYGNTESNITTSKCSVFATGPIFIEGKHYEPSDEIKLFVNSLREGSLSGDR